MTTTTSTAPATEKQIAFLQSLHNQVHGCDFDGAETLSKATASGLIDALITLKKANKTAYVHPVHDDLESGMYRKDGVIYKVYKAVHGSGKMCAKRLNEQPVPAGEPRSFTFEYVGLAAKHGLAAFHRMTLEQAKEFGAIYGVCCVCAATLTDEESIAAGIGPICGSKGW